VSSPEAIAVVAGMTGAGPSNAERRAGLILAFLSIAQFMVFLDVSIVNVALPSIQTSLHISEPTLPYVVTAYGTLLGGCLLFGSRLADTFGRRRVLQLGLALFGTASLIAGLSQGPTLLFLARGAQGLGSALIAPAALSTLTTTFAEGPARAKALGVWGALAGIASVCGVIFGGLLAQGPGWRWIFFVNVPIAAAAVGLAPAVLPESRGGTRRHFDIGGAVVLTGALLLLIYTLDEAISAGWAQARTIGGIAGAVLLLAAFVVIERRADSPLVPFGIFRLPALRTANLATLFLLGCVVTVFFFASLFMQQVLDYSAVKTGMAYVPLAVIVALGAGLASGLMAKAPARIVLSTGLILTTGGLLMLARLPSHAGYGSDVLPAFLIIGLGMGLSFVPLQIAAQLGVGENEAGLAAGLINTSQEVGGALGVAIAASIAFSRVAELTRHAHGDPDLVLAGRANVFHHGFFAGACFAAAALLVSALLLPSIPAAGPDGAKVIT
jgi:EmrB/QacA subfamily drug resistance transporter